MRTLILPGLLVLVLAGCASTAGPFVTSVSSDGRGGIIVEKCVARFNPWTETVSNADCRTTTIQIRPVDASGR